MVQYCKQIVFAESVHMDLKELLRAPNDGVLEDGVHPYGDGILFYHVDGRPFKI